MGTCLCHKKTERKTHLENQYILGAVNSFIDLSYRTGILKNLLPLPPAARGSFYKNRP
jgi:hypothetical protein